MEKEYQGLQQSDRLLEVNKDDESCQEHEDFYAVEYSTHRWYAAWKINAVFISILVVSLVQNGLLYQRNKVLAEKATMGISKYTGLPTNIPMVYTYRTDYFGDNETLADELWDNLDLTASVVALSPEYVAEHKLEKSSPFPWDTEKDMYFLKVFHSLHCLKYMRKAFMDFEAGNEAIVASAHVYHCLDSLRQDIMCKADDTPMPSPQIHDSVGDNQVLQCRDLSKVIEWATAPERGACYQAGNDFRPVLHNLERHSHCPVDSPYYPVVEEYYQKHKHQNPWGDDDDNEDRGNT
jgi:hypothetical protein